MSPPLATFDFAADVPAALEFLKRTRWELRALRKVRVCSLAESLGGVETLISHPATMTHAALGEKGRKAIGLTDGMVRISVGIENVEDILEDLDQALGAI